MSNFGGKVATSKNNNVKQQQNANASTKQEKPSDLEVEIKPDHAFGLYTNSTQYGHPGYIRDTLVTLHTVSYVTLDAAWRSHSMA